MHDVGSQAAGQGGQTRGGHQKSAPLEFQGRSTVDPHTNLVETPFHGLTDSRVADSSDGEETQVVFTLQLLSQRNRHLFRAAQVQMMNDLQDTGPSVLRAHRTAPPVVCHAWASAGLVADSSQPSCPVAAPRRCASSRAIPKPKKLQNQMPPCGLSR